MQRMRRLIRPRRSPLFDWGFAAAAFATALGLRFWLHDALPPGFPFLTFFPAVILTGFFAGNRPGIAVAVGCGLAAWYWFIGPAGVWSLNGPAFLALGFYVVIVTTDLVLIHLMRTALLKLDAEKQHSDDLAQQNKLMFHEMQHRISNNLQVVASLLKLQMRGLEEPAARAALETASARLQVIARLQRRLHSPKRQITDMGELLAEVLPEVVSTSATGTEMSELRVDGRPLLLNGDQATPAGLVTVELVSNALEHGGAGTRIEVSTRTEGEDAVIVVQDGGKGLPPDFVPEKSRSLGLRVAHQFAEQLGGSLKFESLGGTRVTLRFPVATLEADPA